MPRLLVLLTDKQFKALHRLKRQDGIAMGEFIRRAVDNALTERSKSSTAAPKTR